MEKVIGIDLGTTNSAAAYVDGFTGKGECVINQDGGALTASAVCFENRDNVMIGDIARECKILYPETTATLFKRLMGVQKVAITVDAKNYSPQQLSALILKRLKTDAEVEMGQDIKKAVITVPAYFDSNRRQATIEAGQEAGLEVMDLLDEPVAALYSADSIANYAGKVVLIFDLGGGTLDLVCAKVTKESIDELVITGDVNLGGSDWDKSFAQYIKESYLKGCQLDVEGEQELANKAELAKKELSHKEMTSFTVMTRTGRKGIKVTLKEFENCTSHLLARAMRILAEMKETLEEKGIQEPDQIILCGGATRMNQILKGIRNIYPDVSIYAKDRDQAVAKGAAIYAKALQEEQQPKIVRSHYSSTRSGEAVKIKKLNRVTSRSYGIVAYVGDDEKKVCNMLLQNVELPAVTEEVFYTRYDNQKQVSLEVFESTQSNRYEEINSAAPVGKCCLNIDGQLPKHSPIMVSIRLEENGTLCIHGYEESGKTEVTAHMQTQALLSPGELVAERSQVEDVFVKIE